MLSFRCEVVGVGGVGFTVSLRGVFGVNGRFFGYEPEGVGAFPWLQASVGVFSGVGWYDPPSPPCGGTGAVGGMCWVGLGSGCLRCLAVSGCGMGGFSAFSWVGGLG